MTTSSEETVEIPPAGWVLNPEFEKASPVLWAWNANSLKEFNIEPPIKE